MAIEVSKEQVKSFLFRYHHLTEDTQITDLTQIPNFVKKVGCIQFDPLNVVGRNPDLVLQARFLNYQENDILKYLYEDRKLIDIWDKNMSICHIDDWPNFSYFRERYIPTNIKLIDGIKVVKQYLRDNDFACSADFELNEKIKWHFGNQRLSRVALECMCYNGEAIVHHKIGNRRHYGLAEKYIPQDIFNKSDINKTKDEYFEWLVLRRINSIGVLWKKASDAWLGIFDFKSKDRKKAFLKLKEKGMVEELNVVGLKYPLYISSQNLELLLEKNSIVSKSYSMRFLAPLDNLLWDRKLIKEIFGFEYKWEVYTPAKKRIYGYYVLPIVAGNNFIGRIELKYDRKHRILKVLNIWYEEDEDGIKYCEDLKKCLIKFGKYLSCDRIIQNTNH